MCKLSESEDWNVRRISDLWVYLSICHHRRTTLTVEHYVGDYFKCCIDNDLLLKLVILEESLRFFQHIFVKH